MSKRFELSVTTSQETLVEFFDTFKEAEAKARDAVKNGYVKTEEGLFHIVPALEVKAARVTVLEK